MGGTAAEVVAGVVDVEADMLVNGEAGMVSEVDDSEEGVGVGAADELRTAEVAMALDIDVLVGGTFVAAAELSLVVAGAELSLDVVGAELSEDKVLVLQFPGEIPSTFGAHSPAAGGATGLGAEEEGENARTIVPALEVNAEQAQGSAFC